MHTYGQMFVYFVSLCAIRSHSEIQLLMCLTGSGHGLVWLLRAHLPALLCTIYSAFRSVIQLVAKTTSLDRATTAFFSGGRRFFCDSNFFFFLSSITKSMAGNVISEYWIRSTRRGRAPNWKKRNFRFFSWQSYDLFRVETPRPKILETRKCSWPIFYAIAGE